MRLRPATPLSILLFAAFALLLLSVLSTPVITSIHLAAYGDIAFGVFGFCDSKGCSGVRVGYDMRALSPTNSDFSLPSNARNSLSNLLIVHPIAALFTLILLVLAVISHLHSPAHSPRYLLALLILALPTFLLSLLAFLVDILIFLPHVQWGGWVVLGATILIAIAGVVMCGMRRTVVSKQARRKRIEDNAATNGQEFYASQALARERAAAPVQHDKLPEFATFEVNKTTPGEPEGERIPLNPRSRTVSPPIPGTGSDGSFTRSNTLTREPSDRSVGYGPPPRGAGPLSRPMPSGQVRNQYSNGTLQAGASGSSGPYGVPPPQRGGYDRGYGGDVYGERGGTPLGGFRGPTPPSMYPPAGGLAPPPRRGPSPGQLVPRPPTSNSYGGGGPGYGMGPLPNNGIMGPPPQGGMRGGQVPYGGMGGPPPGVVMTGAGGPIPPSGPQQYDFPEDEVADERREFEKTLPMAGAVGVGGARGDERGGGLSGLAELDEHPSEPHHTGRLSVVNENGRSTPQDEYVPPRQAWKQQHSGTPPPQSRSPPPVELPAGPSSSPPSDYPPTSPTNAASSYYEDVVPAFDTNLPHPRSLTPGYPTSSSSSPHNPPSFSPPPLPIDPPHRNPSNQTLEDLQDGQRSPTMSLSSNFTSISQRPPNPNWQPPPQQQQQYQQGRRGPTASQVLGGNPDFMLPGNGRGGQRGRGGGPVGMGR